MEPFPILECVGKLHMENQTENFIRLHSSSITDLIGSWYSNCDKMAILSELFLEAIQVNDPPFNSLAKNWNRLAK
jgi:hypothetical protein